MDPREWRDNVIKYYMYHYALAKLTHYSPAKCLEWSFSVFSLSPQLPKQNKRGMIKKACVYLLSAQWLAAAAKICDQQVD